MTAVSHSFIQRLPTATQRVIAVKVVPMKFEHVHFWHTHVQPIIDRFYSKASAGKPATNFRADVGWDWTMNFALMALHNSAILLPTNGSGLARGFAVIVDAEDGTEVPFGLLTMVPRFDTKVFGIRRERTFAWYLSDAPSEFYDALKIAPLKLMAKALLDTALQAGWLANMDGEFLLHADPAGGTKLQQFYLNSCKMTSIPPGRARISALRRGSRGGYFLFTAPQASAFSAQLDPFR